VKISVSGIVTACSISEHLFEMGEQIELQDLLRIMRLLGEKGKNIYQYFSSNAKIYYTDKEVTEDEFKTVLSKSGEDYKIEDIVNEETREDLLAKVKPLLELKCSATKKEITEKIAQRKDILFKYFRDRILDRRCKDWKGFIDDKEVIPACDHRTLLIFEEGSLSYKPLLPEGKIQFWAVGNEKLKINNNYETRRIGKNLFINLKDSDEKIMGLVEELWKEDPKDSLAVSAFEEGLDDENLGFRLPEEISYSTDIDNLSSYFGERHSSKFETFSLGLAGRQDLEFVRKNLNKTFLVTLDNIKVYTGRSFNKESFEKIALHLKVEHMDEKSIICRAVDEKTEEAISALWERTGNMYNRDKMEFKAVRLD